MLAGIAGPMVFLSVAWGICGIGDMAALGRSGKALVTRFLGADLLATLFTIAVCLPLIPLGGGARQAASEGTVAGIVKLLLELLPTNLIAPFSEGNTLQIIVLAVTVGIGALALGNVTEGIRSALRELNILFLFLMEQLCRLLPAFIVVMVVYQTWSGMVGELLASWRPVVMTVACMAAFLLLQVVVVALRGHIPVARMAKAIAPPLLISLTTASSSAAFGSMLSCCKDDLGVDDDLVGFGIPLGLVVNKAMMAIQIVVLMLFAAQVQGVGADVGWYVRLGVISLLYAVAIPPVPGGSLACYGMMLAGLGIPAQVLGILTALDLLLDYPCTAGNVGGLILSVFSAADSLDLVERDVQTRE